MWNVWDVRDAQCSGYGMMGMWYFWDVGCWGCEIFGNVGCWGCGMLIYNMPFYDDSVLCRYKVSRQIFCNFCAHF